jgi:hypothetical protein
MPTMLYSKCFCRSPNRSSVRSPGRGNRRFVPGSEPLYETRSPKRWCEDVEIKRLVVPRRQSFSQLIPSQKQRPAKSWWRLVGKSSVGQLSKSVRNSATKSGGSFNGRQWTEIDGVPIGDVAQSSGRSVGSIYIVRFRVITRIKEKIQEVSQQWDLQEHDS